MAADWIKMRGNLWDDPRVARLCDLTGAGEATIIGGLYWLWSMADQHSLDGSLPGMSPHQIDRKSGVAGLADALLDVGWLVATGDGVEVPRFNEHNGRSAKKRAETGRRVVRHRTTRPAAEPTIKNTNPENTRYIAERTPEMVAENPENTRSMVNDTPEIAEGFTLADSSTNSASDRNDIPVTHNALQVRYENVTSALTRERERERINPIPPCKTPPLPLAVCNAGFEALWKRYPVKEGKKAALRHYTASVRSAADARRVEAALENYLLILQEQPDRPAQHGSTWFNNWQDYEGPECVESAREQARRWRSGRKADNVGQGIAVLREMRRRIGGEDGPGQEDDGLFAEQNRGLSPLLPGGGACGRPDAGHG